jgi:hypothetical protein
MSWRLAANFVIIFVNFQAKLKRSELQKNRMREAFVAAKMRLQGKIKSKK